jgi:hypothetical protein
LIYKLGFLKTTDILPKESLDIPLLFWRVLDEKFEKVETPTPYNSYYSYLQNSKNIYIQLQTFSKF